MIRESPIQRHFPTPIIIDESPVLQSSSPPSPTRGVHVEHAIRRLKGNKILHAYRRRGDTLTATISACAALVTLPA